ncbi:hypothetical protein [Symmachiella dynata]|uniref:hypothetical protein n=1 Tax=Symmachiella dynata TaxID=2527995 RepID=UPI0030EF3397
MNTTRTLTFQWTGWSLGISIVVVLVTAAYCYAAWRRSGYQRTFGLLELLRLVLVIFAAVMFNQPEYIEEFLPDEKPSVVVLWDDSRSMETRDVKTAGQSADALTTRRDAIAPLTESSAWHKLHERINVVLQPFSSPKSPGSNLYQPLNDAMEKQSNLLGVVFASDGDWNEGPPPVQAATRMRLKEIPIFAVPVGSSIPLPDVELLSLDAPTFGVAGKSVRIPFSINSSLPRDHVATVTMRTSDGEELQKEINVKAMGRTSEWIIWKPEQIGDYQLTVNVPTHHDESLTDNNELSAPISIREEKLRVLVVESYPRWEYRYLRNALSRDPGVEVSCLLFHPGLSKVGGGNRDYIKEFPDGLDELSQYDVVFLGDVGLDDGQLTVEQCRLLKGLVEHQASGLVFMPGFYGRQFSLLETELDALYPVVLDEAQPGGWGSRTPSHFELTELGRRSLLTKLADTREDNIEVWSGLPGFQWHAPVLRARAGTDVLSVHESETNKNGRVPLLVTRTYGAGKVLFMGTDGAWRWRKGVEDKYHYRFWGQVVRWMAYQRNMAKGESMRLYYSPDQPQIDQTVMFNANVMEKSGEPLTKGDVVARITSPSGKLETVRFVSAGDEWGAFAGRFTTAEPGQHEMVLTCKQTGTTLETSFFVQGVANERAGRPARPEVLDELARVTRGKVIAADKIDDVMNSLAALPDPPASVRRVQLWSHPVPAACLIALFGVFWVGRKAAGLI